jgi:hypothetical protein
VPTKPQPVCSVYWRYRGDVQEGAGRGGCGGQRKSVVFGIRG